MIKNSQGFYQLERFLLPGLIHGISTKKFGDMSFVLGEKEQVAQNREHFAKALGLNTNKTGQMVAANGTKIVDVTSQDSGSLYSLVKAFRGTDGMITKQRGIALLVLTGDCLPIIFYDPKKKVIAVAHSGWMGTIGKVSSKVVARMMATYGSRSKDILVGIGPAIEKCHFVDPAPFVQERFPEWQDFIWREGKKTRVDLSGFVIKELLDIGIPQQNIDHVNYCTQDHSDEFFCSQEETSGKATPGRFMTAIQTL